jgi:SSS family solute:Na+ symporter
MRLISGQLYQYLQSVQAYISPPIAAVFLIGVFWKRVNARGAIASLLTGFILGMGRLVAELNKSVLDGVLFTYADINFLHFAIFLFMVCSTVLIVVSLASPAPSRESIAGLTYATAEDHMESEAQPAVDLAWRRKDLFLSVLLVLCVGGVWLLFSG